MFAATRSEALSQLENFIPFSGKYSRDRNHVFPYDHHNVSCLSPAIRHRLITEGETAQAPLARYAPSTIEKFTQEIYWRRYWKSWLSLRPQVWSDYKDELSTTRTEISPTQRERLQQVCQGQSGLAIMDLFTRELVETGYLHNHARMWWAGWWIHVERLPWALGADFFYQHLLDADPASNTLSWRWVAGLQTRGKSYLPRRSNLEKYLPPELLKEHSQGLELLEKPTACRPETDLAKPPITQPELSNYAVDQEKPSLLLVHEEDLSPETCHFNKAQITHVLVVADRESWREAQFSEKKCAWLENALQDTLQRMKHAFPSAEVHPDIPDLNSQILSLLEKPEQVISLRPEVGLLADRCHELGLTCHWLDRPEDLTLRPLATAGFFGFWKKIQNQTRKSEAPLRKKEG